MDETLTELGKLANKTLAKMKRNEANWRQAWMLDAIALLDTIVKASDRCEAEDAEQKLLKKRVKKSERFNDWIRQNKLFQDQKDPKNEINACLTMGRDLPLCRELFMQTDRTCFHHIYSEFKSQFKPPVKPSPKSSVSGTKPQQGLNFASGTNSPESNTKPNIPEPKQDKPEPPKPVLITIGNQCSKYLQGLFVANFYNEYSKIFECKDSVATIEDQEILNRLRNDIESVQARLDALRDALKETVSLSTIMQTRKETSNG